MRNISVSVSKISFNRILNRQEQNITSERAYPYILHLTSWKTILPWLITTWMALILRYLDEKDEAGLRSPSALFSCRSEVTTWNARSNYNHWVTGNDTIKHKDKFSYRFLQDFDSVRFLCLLLFATKYNRCGTPDGPKKKEIQIFTFKSKTQQHRQAFLTSHNASKCVKKQVWSKNRLAFHDCDLHCSPHHEFSDSQPVFTQPPLHHSYGCAFLWQLNLRAISFHYDTDLLEGKTHFLMTYEDKPRPDWMAVRTTGSLNGP